MENVKTQCTKKDGNITVAIKFSEGIFTETTQKGSKKGKLTEKRRLEFTLPNGDEISLYVTDVYLKEKPLEEKPTGTKRTTKKVANGSSDLDNRLNSLENNLSKLTECVSKLYESIK